LFAAFFSALFAALRRHATARAAAIRCRESLVLSSCEEVALLTRAFEKPALSSGVRFDSTVMQNVADRRTARRQRAGDQQTAMAIKRIALRTHQAQTAPSGVHKQSIEPILEARPPRHDLVIGDAVAIERRIARPCRRRAASR
jgi:hypothetical protein